MKKSLVVIRNRITMIKIEEAANAVIYVLEEHDKRFHDNTLRKAILLERIPEAISKMRDWKKDGKKIGVSIPAVENHEVDIANAGFVCGHWKDICLLCAEFGYFVIWNPPGEAPGLRLGTIDEYGNQQGLITGITSGFANYHNDRTKIIEQHGCNGTELHVEVSRHKIPEGEQHNADG